MPQRFTIKDSSDSDTTFDYPYTISEAVGVTDHPLALVPQGHRQNENRGDGSSLGIRGQNYMISTLHDSVVSYPSLADGSKDTCDIGKKEDVSFTSFLSSIGSSENFLQKGSAYFLQLLSNPQQLFWLGLVILGALLFFPKLSLFLGIVIGVIVIGGYQNEDNKITTRTAKWTVTGFSQQMKDGFLASPPFLDKCGQWRMVIKQKKGMEGLQTSFGLMCTDIFPEIDHVTACISFFCTNQVGQEVNTGGIRTHKFHHEYKCPGDCGFAKPIRLSRRQLGDTEVITIHCTVEFNKKAVTFLKTVSRNFKTEVGPDSEDRLMLKKGKNVVVEHGMVLPGDLEFHEEGSLSPEFRPVMRFVQHSETRTFIWEIPAFTSLLEGSELWGIYSPQFFVNSHDVCSIWRMKLLEVQGVFRLHVQLRGLPNTLRQVKLWYLLQLVDMYGDSVIPEHAVSRVKYPDHMNLWDTTRHILYRRESILERFIGVNGTLTLRISLQMEPNDVSLMEVDSDEWIHSPNREGGQQLGQLEASSAMMR